MMLSGRRILVTGASSGIGRATVTALADAGAAVVATGRDEERLASVAGRAGVHGISADLTVRAEVDDLVGRAVEAMGGVDGLVNSAGLALPTGIVDADPQDWRRQFDVNVLGLLGVTQAALPFLRRADVADVVNVSSLSGRRVASWQMGVYSATKFAVHALSEGLRQELADTSVRVTVVAPGYVDTSIFDGVDEEYAERTATLGLDPDDVARAIVSAISQPPGVSLHEIAMSATER